STSSESPREQPSPRDLAGARHRHESVTKPPRKRAFPPFFQASLGARHQHGSRKRTKRGRRGVSEIAVLASDAERDHVVTLLREAAVEGRLTLEEFTDRMGRAYLARTNDALDELIRDLPSVAAPRRRTR